MCQYPDVIYCIGISLVLHCYMSTRLNTNGTGELSQTKGALESLYKEIIIVFFLHKQ